MDDDITDAVAVLNLWAVAGLAVAGVLGFGALFLMPTLRNRGISVSTAFLLITALEGVAALIAVVAVQRLHTKTG
jgi:hypothetical protein